MEQDKKATWVLSAIGVVASVWLAVLLAPTLGGELFVMLPKLTDALSHPFRFSWCRATMPCVAVFLFLYTAALLIYRHTKPNHRRRVEHGSAKWGDVRGINRKYCQKPWESNRIP